MTGGLRVGRRAAALLFLATFAGIVFASHARLLDLPYYWDELGQFIPASLDLYQHGYWIPHTTLPNVHPPGLMAVLALVWHVFGYSIAATRVTMLLMASAMVFGTFLLAIRLSRGAAPFFAVLLLLVSPLFYTQSLLAQLDLPAALFTIWVLLLFLDGRYRAAALLSIPLVLMKETGIVVPAVLGGWLWFHRKRALAWWFALPALPLAVWLSALTLATGHLCGNGEFTSYNLAYPLNPIRLAVAFLRRIAFLCFADGHWIGWIAIWAAWKRGLFRSYGWRVAATVAAAQVLAVTVTGGARLERYLLPALPVIYIAMAAAFAAVPRRWARAGQFAMVAALAAGLFWSAPYPTPYENNLAMVDFVRLQQSAARFVEAAYPARTVATAWPLSDALRRPELGYVRRPLRVRGIGTFTASDVTRLDPASVDLFVLYSRDRERPLDFRRIPQFARLYNFEPQMTETEIERRFGLAEAGQFRSRGQWVTILGRR